MEDKKLTVVMSAYNHGKYVEKAILSVLNQTYKDFYFYVADDCSSDDTADVILRYENEIDQIHIYNTNGRGRLKELVDMVTTPYVAIINSDDYWDLEKLERQMEHMENHPECAACFTGCRDMDENGVIVSDAFYLNGNRSKEEWMYYFYCNGNMLAHPSVLIKTDIYRWLLDVNPGMYFQCGDWYMWLRLVQKYDMYVIQEELTNFVRHRSGTSTNESAPTVVNIVRGQMDMAHFWHDIVRDMDDEYFRKAFSSAMVNPSAATHEEIICEKFFVLLNSELLGIQDAASYYYYNTFTDKKLYQILVDKYGYTHRKFFYDNVGLGMAKGYIEAYADLDLGV